MTPRSTAADAVQRFLDAVRGAAIGTCDAWTEDVLLDATVPNWRFHRRGAAAVRETYQGWFADPETFEELERMPVEGGEVVRYTLTWDEAGVPHAAHHLHVLGLRNGRISSDTVLCGGRWSAALLAEMEAADG